MCRVIVTWAGAFSFSYFPSSTLQVIVALMVIEGLEKQILLKKTWKESRLPLIGDRKTVQIVSRSYYCHGIGISFLECERCSINENVDWDNFGWRNGWSRPVAVCVLVPTRILDVVRNESDRVDTIASNIQRDIGW